MARRSTRIVLAIALIVLLGACAAAGGWVIHYRSLLSGEDDSAVPLSQAQALADKLHAAGTEVTLIVVENANHNFKPTGGPIRPARGEISELVAGFFDRHLR